MTYLQTRKSPVRRHGRTILAVSAVIIVLGAAIQIFRPSFFPALATSFARPFWRAGLSLEMGSLKTPEALLEENQFLQRELDDANARLQTIGSIEAENGDLKSLMGRASTTSYILAAVLERPPLSSYDELIIDAGADNGFSVGNNVYATGDVLIGRISQVLGQTSKVRLLSSPGETYSVFVGQNNSPATAVGRGGGQYEAELPRDIKIAEGDFVIAPSLNDKPFGVVSSVLTDPAQPFEKILFAPPVNIYGLRWVLVDPKIRLI
jgi:cell shape-determining protein MreC